MNEATFDALARQAGSIHDRRTSLKVLGAAAFVAAAAAPLTAEAGKSGKKAKKKCKKQVGPCNTFSNEVCELFFDPGSEFDFCVAEASACCAPLKKCAATSFFDCALVVLATLLDPA